MRDIQQTIPANVLLLAAAKTRTLEEVEAVIQAGITHLGYNYVQESLPIIETLSNKATWHMIGHLQRNKAKIVAEHFDMIETVDSWELRVRCDSCHAEHLTEGGPVAFSCKQRGFCRGRPAPAAAYGA